MEVKIQRLQKSDYPSQHYYEKFKSLARWHEYDSPEEMLHDMYENQNLGTVELAKKLKVRRRVILLLLDLIGADLRPGGNHSRQDIDNKKVKEYLKNHTYQEAAGHFECSFSTIQHINADLRRDHLNSPKTEKKKRRTCTCCGKYPVKNGNRFLCKYCYTGEPHKYKKSGIST